MQRRLWSGNRERERKRTSLIFYTLYVDGAAILIYEFFTQYKS